MKQTLRKIYFALQQDEAGYPPFQEEILWGKKVNDTEYIIDNIPFYVYDLSLGDKIVVKNIDKKLVYDRIVVKSDNSTIRIYCKDSTVKNKLKKELKALGCKWEGSNINSLSAINIPLNVALNDVIRKIKDCKIDNPELEFEEASLRSS